MLSFTKGELSTIAGPIQNNNYASNLLNTASPIPLWSSKAFDFRDLPCPPQSVMVNSVFQAMAMHELKETATGTKLVHARIWRTISPFHRHAQQVQRYPLVQ